MYKSLGLKQKRDLANGGHEDTITLYRISPLCRGPAPCGGLQLNKPCCNCWGDGVMGIAEISSPDEDNIAVEIPHVALFLALPDEAGPLLKGGV